MLRISSCFILFFCLLIPNLALTDPWSQFQEFNDGYYYLDDQSFESFTCTVTLPTVKAMIRDIQRQISSGGQKHLIRQNLDDFRMTFHKNGELTFTRPSLSVQVDETGDTDEESRANMVAGVKMIEGGFKSTLDGVVMTLESLFSSYIRPRQETYKLESFSQENGKTGIRYETGGLLLDVSCQGSECSKSTSIDTTTVEGAESYMKVSGKYALESYHGIVKQKDQATETRLAITYQEAGKLKIPREIKGESTITRASGSANGTFHIILEDCIVRSP